MTVPAEFDMGKARQDALHASCDLRDDIVPYVAPALAVTLLLTCHGCGGPVTITAKSKDTDMGAARVLACRGRCTSKPGVLQIKYLYGNV